MKNPIKKPIGNLVFTSRAGVLLAVLCSGSLPSFATNAAELGDSEAEFDDSYLLEDDIPVVLTATRLKQPRAEVPASVTVISADDIQAWGVRTLPELMRFVPGMFIGHGDDENNASVIYHASTPNIMRRLQVLVDGRSVFRASIASVTWDDIPVALEDIARIEVTRGPSAATYGANSFLGVINIISKHPDETLGVRVRYRNGSEGYDDSFVSYSGVHEQTSYRISAQINADNGYDGNEENGRDDWRDGRRHGFVNAHVSQPLSNHSHLDWQASYKKGHTDIRKDSFDTSFPDLESEQGHLWGKWSTEFSEHHASHLQAYWQIDSRDQQAGACVPTISLDPALFEIYQSSPYLSRLLGQLAPSLLAGDDPAARAQANGLLGGIATQQITPEVLEQQLEGLLFEREVRDRDSDTDRARKLARVQAAVEVSQADLNLASGALQRAFNGTDFSQAAEVVCGHSDRGGQEQRFDIEWQDTIQWAPGLRTVSGVSFRRDQVHSQTLFNGTVRNDTYRFFANAEWRALDWLVINAGGMYEIEDNNDDAFSPRIAANFLLAPQHSIRAVYSQAVRSPDLVEQNPDYRVTIENLSPNYLGLDSGVLFVNQADMERDLKHEEITSIELGYYGATTDWQWDFKVYRDSLTRLISNPIALSTTVLTSDSEMEIDGAELQLRWQASQRDWLRLAAAYVNPVYDSGNTDGLTDRDVSSLERIELRASARDSVVASWHHQGNRWSFTGSHFWYDRYGDSIGIDNRRYRRYEINLRKEFQFAGTTPWVGVFWHHIVDQDPLVYSNQRYENDDLYYVQLGLNF